MYSLIANVLIVGLQTSSLQAVKSNNTQSLELSIQESKISPFVPAIFVQAPQPETLPGNSSEILRFSIKEFRFQGNTLLSNEILQEKIKEYLGENKTINDLISAQEVLAKAYQDAGYGLVSISLPQRQSLEGIFKIDIREVRISQVTITGNKHFSNETIRAALPELEAGKVPNLDQLSRQLFLANDNPSRQLVLNFQPAEPGETNVEIKVQDQDPQRWAIRLDNTGNDATGRTRLSLIAQNSNLWERGHLAAFSVTVSPEKLDKVKQFGLFYQFPLPDSGDAINFNAGYSDVNSGRIADIFNVSGQGFVTGLHYVHNLSRTALDRQTLDFGLDYRLFQNNVDFRGINLGVDVAAFPISLGYEYTARRGDAGFSAGLSYVRNIPGVFSRNDDRTYNYSRFGATANWDLVTANLGYQQKFEEGWLFNLQVAGQYAGKPLISGEQFGLGGMRSIRGLEERETAGDNALRSSLEIYTPELGLGNRLLVFTDFGRYWRENTFPGEVVNDNVWTMGLGWRWNWQQLNTSVDLGYVLDGSVLSKPGDMRVHFSLQYSF